MRTARHKLSHNLETGELELYDLELDPHERENLASDSRHAEVRERLLARLAGWASRKRRKGGRRDDPHEA